jgi:hypothetical protein
MHPMRYFHPERICRLHDSVDDVFIVWHPSRADRWRQRAEVNPNDGTVAYDGQIFDGWEPVRPPER